MSIFTTRVFAEGNKEQIYLPRMVSPSCSISTLYMYTRTPSIECM